MKKLSLLLLTFTVISIFLSINLELARASAPVEPSIAASASSTTQASWFIDTIDVDGSVGSHASISFSPKNGWPYISYYDEANGDLRLARPDPTNGNCGPDNTWKCEVIDSIGDVGMYNSIAFHQTENGWKVGISYYDATNQALKYASCSCNPLCPVHWAKITVVQGSGADNGRYTSLAFDDTGTPHISYQRIDESTDPVLDPVSYELYYAHPVDN